MRDRKTLRGRSGTVRIERTDAGVAQVTSDDFNDALLGLGYCHARDRGLQMLFVRTLGRGEGSQRLQASNELLASDRFFRRLNFGGDALSQWEALTPRAGRPGGVLPGRDSGVRATSASPGSSGSWAQVLGASLGRSPTSR